MPPTGLPRPEALKQLVNRILADPEFLFPLPDFDDNLRGGCRERELHVRE
jgi:hypothetical protein